MAEPQRSKEAFELKADHVESQLSGVHTRAKPTAPKLDATGSDPQTVPQRRSDASNSKSKQRRSASVRQTWKMALNAARMASSPEGSILLRAFAPMRSLIMARAI